MRKSLCLLTAGLLIATAWTPDAGARKAFAQSAKANVHLRALYGRSSHHQVEAMFKAFARALRFAVARDKRLLRVLPSTKGLL